LIALSTLMLAPGRDEVMVEEKLCQLFSLRPVFLFFVLADRFFILDLVQFSNVPPLPEYPETLPTLLRYVFALGPTRKEWDRRE